MVRHNNRNLIFGKVSEIKNVLAWLTYPYNRAVAGEHGSFSRKDYEKWLENVDVDGLAGALTRLARLNQVKVYLFWQKNDT